MRDGRILWNQEQALADEETGAFYSCDRRKVMKEDQAVILACKCQNNTVEKPAQRVGGIKFSDTVMAKH
jgi:hypothetical protein